MADTMNMISRTVEQFLALIREQMEDEDYTPVLGFGKSGIGKTEGVAGLCEELGIGFKEIRLINHTETDLIGVPYLENIGDGKVTKFANNSLLPVAERDGERGILVLDELPSAPINMRTIAYQLLDKSRGVGQYKLPPKWLVVGLGNGVDDGGNYQGMEAALLNRCNCVRVDTDLESWKRWAVKAGVNPTVIAYLSFKPGDLHNLNINEDVQVFPSPRSWVALSKKLNSREKRAAETENGKRLLEEEDVEVYAACAVGANTAPDFSAFYQYNKKVDNVEDIISGKVKEAKMMEPQAVYILGQGIVAQFRKEVEKTLETRSEYSDENLQRCANICRYGASMGSKRMADMAYALFNDLRQSVPQFSAMVVDDRFDELCPEFYQFSMENRSAFDAR